MLDSLKKIIKNAGTMILEAKEIHSHTKSGARDIVTEWDYKVQDYVKTELAKLAPDASFLGEEGERENINKEKCFIVDPIDGTMNFRSGIKKSACSIAYAENGKVQIGLVYDPYLDELFYAERGKGSYCNGEPLHALQGAMDKGITIFGTSPYDSQKTESTFKLAKLCYDNTLDLRRFGAATLDFCYVASGRAVLFFEGSLCPWDFAAGSLIAEEQGIILRTWDNEPLDLFERQSVVCGNPEAVEQWFCLYKSI